MQKRCFEVGVRSEEVGGKKAPHFLYIMKRSELIKILKKYGCYIIREGANHEVWHSEITGHDFPVWRHVGREIPNGTLRNIFREAGIK